MSIGFGFPEDLGEGAYRVGASRYTEDGKKFSASGRVIVNIANYLGDETDPKKQALTLAIMEFTAHPELLVPFPPVRVTKKHTIYRIVDKDGVILQRDDPDRNFFQPSDEELKKGATTYETESS